MRLPTSGAVPAGAAEGRAVATAGDNGEVAAVGDGGGPSRKGPSW